jgi:virginiamycin B lyase
MRLRTLVFLAIVASLAACSLHGGPSSNQSSLIHSPGSTGRAAPHVVQGGPGSHWHQFTPKTNGTLFTGLTVGSDGNIWFIDESYFDLVKMGMDGSTKEFSVGLTAYDMAVGSDKAFWITTASSNIIRATITGTTKVFVAEDTTQAGGVALGPDGDVWFTEYAHIGKITPKGVITEYPYPMGHNDNQYGGVAAGPDGNVWFAESSTNAVASVVPSTGVITEHVLSTECTPAGVTFAKDGNLWFGCLASGALVGKYDLKTGVSTFYTTGYTFNGNYSMHFATEGYDGNPWFATATGGVIFEVVAGTGKVITYKPPATVESPNAVALGPDGNIWVVTVRGGHVDTYIPNPLKVSPTSLTFTGIGQQLDLAVSQHGTSSWTSSSSNALVATVAQGSNSNTFDVTSVGAGTCKVEIADAIGNFVKVKVTVP